MLSLKYIQLMSLVVGSEGIQRIATAINKRILRAVEYACLLVSSKLLKSTDRSYPLKPGRAFSFIFVNLGGDPLDHPLASGGLY